jgi:Glycine rich protein
MIVTREPVFKAETLLEALDCDSGAKRMRTQRHWAKVLKACAATSLLASCSGGYQAATPATEILQNAAPSGSRTFKYTGAAQHFKVPSGVTELTVVARGGGTPSGDFPSSGPYYTGSNGGFIRATISVTSGERLDIFVGGHGDLGVEGAGGAAGFNGGGAGGDGIQDSSYFVDGGVGGGGASDIREGGDLLKDRIVVAGGGGGPGIGAGYLFSAGSGGQGGGKIGGPGGSSYPGNPSGFGGLGGTQTAVAAAPADPILRTVAGAEAVEAAATMAAAALRSSRRVRLT